MKNFGDKNYSVEKQDDGGKEWSLPCLHPMAQRALLDLG
jgi:hypothetical protein